MAIVTIRRRPDGPRKITERMRLGFESGRATGAKAFGPDGAELRTWEEEALGPDEAIELHEPTS